MLNLGVFLTIALGIASGFFFFSENLRSSVGWANDACTIALPLCLHPEWPAIAAAAVICAMLILKLAIGSRA